MKKNNGEKHGKRETRLDVEAIHALDKHVANQLRVGLAAGQRRTSLFVPPRAKELLFESYLPVLAEDANGRAVELSGASANGFSQRLLLDTKEKV